MVIALVWHRFSESGVALLWADKTARGKTTGSKSA